MASKKTKRAVVAVATAAILLLGGTFAWQSISQTALNEASDVINPGGRLHDDFNGENKDVYVENFADDDIFARIRLEEFFEIQVNKGTDAEYTQVIVGEYKEIDGVEKRVGTPFVFGNENYATKDYWNWLTGGSTVYMPTFNKNKDSLEADVNGKYDEDPTLAYADYVTYSVGETKVEDEIYDGDIDSEDEGVNAGDEDIKTIEAVEHTAKKTLTSTLMSMEEWKVLPAEEKKGPYWVYDTDGWVYWAQPIQPDTATGLLLDGIELKQVIDDSWYYSIDVVAQFITADDLGRGNGTGFYNVIEGEPPTEAALELLKAIGVDTDLNVAMESDFRSALVEGGDIQIDGTITATESTQPGNFAWDFRWTEGGTLKGGAIVGNPENASTGTEKGFSKATLFINAEKDYPESGDGAEAATLMNTKIDSDADFGVYVQAYHAPVTLKDVDIVGKFGGLYADYNVDEDAVVTLDNVNITAGGTQQTDWLNTAVAAADGAKVVIESGSFTGDYAVYIYSSGGTVTINGGHFDGKLRADAGNLIVQGGTFTVDPSTFVAEGYEAVYDEDTKVWTVKAN